MGEGQNYSNSAIQAANAAAASAINSAKQMGSAAASKMPSVPKEVRSVAMLMMVLGLFHYFARLAFGDTNPFVFFFSLILFVLSGYAMAEKVQVNKLVIAIPMAIFSIWYFAFKANYMPQFLIVFLSICGLILVGIDLLTKGKALQAELYGFLPVVFLFLDLGLIPFLIENVGLPITGVTESLVLWMPWWAFFGLMTFPIDEEKESFGNSVLRFFHVLGVIYIVFVFLLPMIPVIGYDTSSIVPDSYTLSESQKNLRDSLSGKENPFWSNLVCAYGAISHPTGDISINTCVDERQEASEISNYCVNEGYDKGSTEHQRCVDEETEKRQDDTLVTGTIDSDLDRHIDIKVEVPSTFDDEIKALSGEYDKVNFPINVIVENPNEDEIKLEFECGFSSTRNDEYIVTGKVVRGGEETSSMELSGSGGFSFLCNPTNDLNGTYNWHFKVTAGEIVTESYLTRVFVEDPFSITESQQKVIDGIFSDVGYESRSSGEFAAVNFAVGEPSNNHIIGLYQQPLLSLNVENLGDGEILVVEGYDLEFDGLYVDVDDFDCISNYGELDLTSENLDKGDTKQLDSCFMQIDSDLEDQVLEEGVVPKTFTARLYYYYQFSNQEKIEVELS